MPTVEKLMEAFLELGEDDRVRFAEELIWAWANGRITF
jgi:hypothetical protein